MKSTSLIVALTLACGISSSALAGEKTKDATQQKTSTPEQSKAKSEAPQKESQVAVTGSYIKRDVRRNGVVTDTASPMFVLDHQAIETSGASDLSQVLLRRGFKR
jgi:hypothetical protein